MVEALVRGPILEKSLKEEQNAEIYIYYLKLKPYSSLIYAFTLFASYIRVQDDPKSCQCDGIRRGTALPAH